MTETIPSHALTEEDSLKQWVDAAVDALKSLTQMMGIADLRFEEDLSPTGDLPGNYIPVYGRNQTYRIGVLGTPSSLETLVRFLVDASPQEPLEPDDIWDGVGEIANILVGNIKTRLGTEENVLSIGLPMMTTGAIVYPRPSCSSVVHVRMAEAPISVVIQVHPLPAEVKRQRALEVEIKEQQEALENARKLDAIGQLAAGIAHEINTPIQYVGDNTRFLQDAFRDLAGLIATYGEMRKATSNIPDMASWDKAVTEMESAIDLEFLLEEIPSAISQSIDGVGRVAGIVAAMKAFSHPGREKAPANLNEAVRNTVTVCRNEWKYASEMTLVLDENLPAVDCVVAEINQVLMNLVVNAAHAIAEKQGPSGEKGQIDISTRMQDDWVEIRVRDSGGGIPAAVQRKVFEPFFTTKEVGKGTGQGLSIARSIIVKKHGGKLFFETEEGEGTTFVLRLKAAEV